MRSILIIFASFTILVLSLFIYASLYDSSPEQVTFIDRNGVVIGSIDRNFTGVRHWANLDEIPNGLREATIAAEDRYFFWHRGINPISIAKAFVSNIAAKRFARGGSTITQQLAKNLIQASDGRLQSRTLSNKLKETTLALALELKHGKGWILERYLNTAYYGRKCYGVAAAAEIYFGKGLADLDHSEIAALVKLPKSPNRNGIKLMAHGARNGAFARHFMEYAAQSVSGLKFAVTLDSRMQKALELAVRESLAPRLERDPLLTAAAVVIDVRSGDLLAMTGSRDYFDDAIDGQVNAAVALRQPGSTLKPFTYFAAFAKGFSPDSKISDEPMSFSSAIDEETDIYAPQNFDRRYHGEMTIREALANSYNIPAVAMLNEIGQSYYHEMLKRFGFNSLDKPPPYYGLSVTLGSGEVRLIELVNAYAALARGGVYLPYRIFKGEALPNPKPICEGAARYAAQITSILSDPKARIKAFGFNEAMEIEDRDVAVKTGTSYGYRDNWTVGYSPSYAVGVWVGHANGTPMDPLQGSTGATGAAPVWHSIMEAVSRDLPEVRFVGIDNSRSDRPRRVTTRQKENLEGISPVKILKPIAGTTYRIHSYLPFEHQGIAAEAIVGEGLDSRLRWYLDDRRIDTTYGSKSSIFLYPAEGSHLLKVVPEAGDAREVAFKVVESSDD